MFTSNVIQIKNWTIYFRLNGDHILGIFPQRRHFFDLFQMKPSFMCSNLMLLFYLKYVVCSKRSIYQIELNWLNSIPSRAWKKNFTENVSKIQPETFMWFHLICIFHGYFTEFNPYIHMDTVYGTVRSQCKYNPWPI